MQDHVAEPRAPKNGFPTDAIMAQWADVLLTVGLERFVAAKHWSGPPRLHDALPAGDPYFWDDEGKPLPAKVRMVRVLLARGWEIVDSQISATNGSDDPKARLLDIMRRFTELYASKDRSELAKQRRIIFVFLLSYFRDPAAMNRPTALSRINTRVDGLYERGQKRGVFTSQVKAPLFRESLFGILAELMYFHRLARLNHEEVAGTEEAPEPYSVGEIQSCLTRFVRSYDPAFDT